VFAVLIALWLYALMVGLQPPVTRATVMISVGLIGPLIFRKAASANTVALAAFAMLALKPALVADPGFQLSFIAVAAIVAIAVPLAEKLRQVGEWKPAARAPHPPSCSRFLKYFAESLFWNERSFRAGMHHSPVQYRLDKAPASRSLALWLAQPVLRWVFILLITSTAIQVATLPLSVLYFNRIAPIGIPINVLSGALTAVMMLGAVVSVSLGSLLPWLSSHLEPIVNSAHRLLVDSAGPFTDIPGATFRAPHFEDWRAVTYLAYFGLLAGLILILERWRPVYIGEPGLRAQDRSKPQTNRAPRKNLRKGRAAAVCGLGLALCFWVIARPSVPGGDGRLVVHFLDVGQGDSALIVFPLGATMLIDAGGEIRPGRGRPSPSAGADEFDPSYSERPDEASDNREAGSFIGEMVVSRFLWSLGLTRIDYAVITHADRDHIGGFSEVIRNFGVGQVVVGSGVYGDSAFRSFADLISDRGIPAARVSAGESFEIEGVTLEVLWPPQAARSEGWGSNDRSIVIRLLYGSVALLLTGDIERDAEAALLKSGNELRADLLKVPHHGSNTSSSEAFLEAVRPACAVISVGERSMFGHPHEAVVTRLLHRGVTLYRTGRDGTVSVKTDGTSLEINNYRGP
jgi:competence protein ComEC